MTATRSKHLLDMCQSRPGYYWVSWAWLISAEWLWCFLDWRARVGPWLQSLLPSCHAHLPSYLLFCWAFLLHIWEIQRDFPASADRKRGKNRQGWGKKIIHSVFTFEWGMNLGFMASCLNGDGKKISGHSSLGGKAFIHHKTARISRGQLSFLFSWP